MNAAVVVRREQAAALEKQAEHLRARFDCTILFHSVCINRRPDGKCGCGGVFSFRSAVECPNAAYYTYTLLCYAHSNSFTVAFATHKLVNFCHAQNYALTSLMRYFLPIFDRYTPS